MTKHSDFWVPAKPAPQSTKKKRSPVKILLYTSIVIALLIILFPPWITGQGQYSYPIGHHLVLDGQPGKNYREQQYARLDYKRLKLYYFVLLFCTGAGYLALRERPVPAVTKPGSPDAKPQEKK